jgi:glucose/arabinose dehydrogenase
LSVLSIGFWLGANDYEKSSTNNRSPAMFRFSILLAIFFFAHPLHAQTISLEPVVSGLKSPIGVYNAGDGSGRLFILEQGGSVRIWNGTQLLTTPFLNVDPLTNGGGEQGLLGIAFHPNYKTNGYFFVSYTDLSGNTVIARYSVSTSNSNVANASSGTPILAVAQPFSNHNGGQIQFGPDGYLYISMGDGGDAGDPGNRAQNLTTLLGKMLRIDVDRGLPYTIPASNPFVSNTNAAVKKEIWAYGLRNAWGFSFDRSSGDLIMGDVGQNDWEEIDFQPRSSSGGENYGWRKMEGNNCFNPSTNCNDGTLKLPIIEYSHAAGNCSVTGGYRYRGSRWATLAATYFYGDLCSGRIWGAKPSGATWTTNLLLDTALTISAFGEDEAGEVYVVDLDSANGAVYRIASTSSTTEIIVDNLPAGARDATRTFTGTWCKSGAAGFYGADSLYSCGSGTDTYRWTPNISSDRAYDVYVRWTANPNRWTSVPVTVVHAGGTTTQNFNQRINGAAWTLLGRFTFNAGTAGYIETNDSAGQANADAVRLVPASGPATAKLTVSKAGSGSGRVSSNPAGVDCGTDCTEDFSLNSVVQVTATPDAGSTFFEWGGPCAGNGACTITMNDSKFLAATFRVTEVIVDNAGLGLQDTAGGRTFTGTWCKSSGPLPFGAESLASCGSGLDTYRWTPKVPKAGGYGVYVWWTTHPNRSTTVPITIQHAGGSTTVNVDQKVNGGKWVLLGTYNFSAGSIGYVQVSDGNGQACADAIKLTPAF